MICLTGAGGKTSLLYALTGFAASKGLHVIASTTTHILKPSSGFAQGRAEVLPLWDAGRFAVIGTPCADEKLTAVSQEELLYWENAADFLLLEADGAKHLPLKVPAQHEPVIPASCGHLIGVMGMHALNRPLQEVCFRLRQAQELLHCGAEHVVTIEDMAAIGTSFDGLAKGSTGRRFSIVLNQCEGVKIRAAEELRDRLRRKGITQVILTAKGCPLHGEESAYEQLLS